MNLAVHRCSNLRVESFFPSNGNSITLEVLADGDYKIRIALFDLPKEVTAKLACLADEHTRNSDND